LLPNRFVATFDRNSQRLTVHSSHVSMGWLAQCVTVL